MRKFIILLLLIIAASFLWTVVKTQERLSIPEEEAAADTAAYADPAYGISFAYPKEWGTVSVREGNDSCPEHETYRTGDTLSRFDREYAFDDIDLPGTESFIRTGIRVYVVTASQEACQDELVRAVAFGTDPATISAVRLEPAPAKGDAFGMYNNAANRLDTEYRAQYTYFKATDGGVLAVQPYFNFIPYAGSPEWAEINRSYAADTAGYVEQGETAGELRKYREQFRVMVGSLMIGDR